MSMRRTARAGSALLTTLVLATAAGADVPRVTVDIAPVHGLVARVMQGVGTPDLLVPPGASPHAYAMRPSDAQALQDADLVVWMGPGLSPWLADPLDTLAGQAARLTLLDRPETQLLDSRSGATFEPHDHGHDHGHEEAKAEGHDHAHGTDGHDDDHDHDAASHDHDHDHAHDAAAHDHDHDHSHEAAGKDHDHAHEAAGHDHGHDHSHEAAGHDHAHDAGAHDHDHAHGGTDPHAWLDPVNGRIWLGLIAEDLAALDPDNAGAYRANATAAQAELDALRDELAATLAPVQDLSFVVFHDAYQYFEVRFGLSAAGAISLSDASDPSAARVAELRDRVAEIGATCALAEPQFDSRLLDAVFDGVEATTGVIDPLGASLEPGPNFYPDLLRGMAQTFVACR